MFAREVDNYFFHKPSSKLFTNCLDFFSLKIQDVNYAFFHFDHINTMKSALFVNSTKAEDDNYARNFQVDDVISLPTTQSSRRMKNSINVYVEQHLLIVVIIILPPSNPR